MEDFLEGNWRGEELVSCFESYALGGNLPEGRINPQVAIRVIDRTVLTREELAKLAEITRGAYDASHDKTGQYARFYTQTDLELAEKYHKVWEHVEGKLKR